MADDLEVLFPDREIVIGAETLTIKPFTARQWPKVIGVFQKLQPLLQPKDGAPVELLTVFAEGADDLYAALGIAAHKPLEWFDDVQMDDAIKLLSLVLEINQTFFVDRIAPMLPDLLARFGLQPKAEEAATDGAEPLPSSSPTDTDGETSKTTPSTKSSSSKEKAAA